MHLQRGRKIIIYFFLLFFLGSINNISLNKIRFSKITNINILGLGNENNKSLLEKIYDLNLANIFFVSRKQIQNLIESNSLVEKYDVFKIYPSSLYINVQKTKFLARINYNGANYIIGSNGKLSKIEHYDETLPFIFGKPKIQKFLRFKDIIDDSKFQYRDIKNIYYFAVGRWDIELSNEIIIKLPEKNIKESLELIFEFLHNNELNQMKVIDARIYNQIILND
tara:strand:+ start:758 stop:1429 length:672 start_codon:yes stop_codon:yes gene_type:complete